ncbi:MAG: AAA family ATPase [Caldilineaceae bacterium]
MSIIAQNRQNASIEFSPSSTLDVDALVADALNLNDAAHINGEQPNREGEPASTATVNPKLSAPPATPAIPTRQAEYTAAQLYDAEFPPPVYAVDGLIPEGLTLLIARPKIGKSWMSLQIGVAVGTGGHALGQQVKQGKVLYLALEDSPLRMQDRMFHKQHAPRDTAMTIIHTWRSLSDDAAITDLMTKIRDGGYTLVIIDTLQRAVGGASVVKDAARLSRILGLLQNFALQSHIAILIVHHSRKSANDMALGGGDVIDDAMGGTEIAGVMDAVLGIYRKRGDPAATLRVTGRDIAEQDLAVNFDKQLFCWQMVGDASVVKANTLQGQIMAAIEQLGKMATLTQIAKFLEKDKGNVSRELAELVNKGALVKNEKVGKEIQYTLPGMEPQPKPKKTARRTGQRIKPPLSQQ